jgi:GH25 family lysozyme M1 (1,4-beta-N-acetylmuramidase)
VKSGAGGGTRTHKSSWLRQEQISGHSETLRQRADMRQRQPSFYRGFYPQVFASKAAAAADIFMNNVNVLRGIG